MTDKRSIKRKIAVGFIAANLLLLCIMWVNTGYERSSRYEKALANAERNGFRIQMQLQNATNIAKMSGQEIFTLYHHGLLETEIEQTLKNYYEINKNAISSIQYSPKGFVKYVVPEEGNEAEHKDIFESDVKAPDARFSVRTGHTTIAGPYEMENGGRGLVIRCPVYANPYSISEELFLGFSSVVIDMEEIEKNVGLFTLKSNDYDYIMTRTDVHEEHEAEEKTVLLERNAKNLKSEDDVAAYHFEIPGYKFCLQVKPHGGWISIPRLFLRIGLAELILALILALVYALDSVKQQAQRLREVSMADGLTGLKNRLAIRADFPTLIGMPVTVIMMDIDYFKKYNDTYGHEMGDQVLRRVAKELSRYEYESCKIYRFGGDEFLIWDTSGNEESALNNVDRMLKSIANIHIKGCDIEIHMSYGVASGVPKSERELRELRKQADDHLYEVKRNRR